MVPNEPLSRDAAKRLIGRILQGGGSVTFRQHALDEMAKDDLTTVDVENVLRAGFVEGHDLISGTWRYRVRTQRMYVVIAFGSMTELRVVTAWRVKT